MWMPQLLGPRPFQAMRSRQLPPAEFTSDWKRCASFAREFMPWLSARKPADARFGRLSSSLISTSHADHGGSLLRGTGSNTARIAGSAQCLHQRFTAGSTRLRQDLPACRHAAAGFGRASAQRWSRLARSCPKKWIFPCSQIKSRNLLSIGFDVEARQLNRSCYDLLASEARTATFVSVAKNDVIQDAWFRLGRQHTACEGETTLISWTGTMFEYLMPVIWMKSHANTLLDRAVRAAVRAQQSYGKSAWRAVGHLRSRLQQDGRTGQLPIRRFRGTGPGTKCGARGNPGCLAIFQLSGTDDRSRRSGRESCRTWQEKTGWPNMAFMNRPTTPRPRRAHSVSRKYNLVRCWMVHHQGMSLAAICNLLCDSPFQRWFHADRMVQASEMILQERPDTCSPYCRFSASQSHAVFGHRSNHGKV